MKKIFATFLGVFCWINVISVYASEKFDILPDLPEPLASAQASSVTTVNPDSASAIANSVGAEPNILSVVFSLLVVILLIYTTGIIYGKLNKVGTKTLGKQFHNSDSSRVSVISTTPLGSNKTLHVVELDGKRMLIGASANSIDLIKDLGSYPPVEAGSFEYSNIEIPNIRIPKIEIPKIEFPNIGFTKTFKKKETEAEIDSEVRSYESLDDDSFEISEIYEESPDGIIDKLFTGNNKDNEEDAKENIKEEVTVHKVDPDEYALYKKYL